MQQPVNMSGAQVIVVTQTCAPMDIQNRYRNMTIAEKFYILGKAQITIGALCIIFQIVSFGFSGFSVGHGMWTGSLLVVTGCFGLFAGKTGGKCQVIAFHVLSTISACFALAMFSASAAFASMHYESISVAMEAMLTLLALIEGAVAVYSSVICCAIGVCCCNCGGSCCCPTDSQYQQFVNPVQPDFAQQHFISDNQQQPMFKPSQQNLVSNPNQQNLLFIPNQQQLMLIQKQKQPMFNLSQQQLVFSTTQPMTGFYSQQYAAQHNGHQQNVLPNPAQPGLSASLQEVSGQGPHAIEYVPANASTQPNDERSLEGLIRFSDSDQHPSQDPPPPYDNDSGLNSHRCQQPGYNGLEHFHIMH